jgi:flagellar motility protein MotE (MotC chaperone)
LANNNKKDDEIIDNKEVLRELSKDFRRLGKKIDLYEDDDKRLASLVTARQKVAKSIHDFKVLAGLIDEAGESDETLGDLIQKFKADKAAGKIKLIFLKPSPARRKK